MEGSKQSSKQLRIYSLADQALTSWKNRFGKLPDSVKGTWYIEKLRQGMGATLDIANERNGLHDYYWVTRFAQQGQLANFSLRT